MMRKLLVAVLACLLGATAAHAQKTKAEISAEIITLFPDNTVGAITPTALRTVTNDLAISIMPTAPVVSGNLACFSGTTGLLSDCGLAPPASAIVGINDTQTLTNKTLTSPTITGATISASVIASPTITSPTITTALTATGLVKYSDLATAAIATASNYYSAAANTVVPASVIYPSEVTITYGATTTVDFDTLINGAVTLTANITTLTLTNVKAGKAGQIRFIQSGAGSFTWPAGGNTIFKYAGGVLPTLTTGSATAVDVLTYSCSSATFCLAALAKDVRNP